MPSPAPEAKHGLGGHRVRHPNDRDVDGNVAYLATAVLCCLARQHQNREARDLLMEPEGLEALDGAAVAYEDDERLSLLALGGLWFVLGQSRNARRAYVQRCGLWSLAALVKARSITTNHYAIAVALLLVADREVTGERVLADVVSAATPPRTPSPASGGSRFSRPSRSPSPEGLRRVPPPSGLHEMLVAVVGLARWCATRCLDEAGGDGPRDRDDESSTASRLSASDVEMSDESSSSSESDANASGAPSSDDDDDAAATTTNKTAFKTLLDRASMQGKSPDAMDVLGADIGFRARAPRSAPETFGLDAGKADATRKDRLVALNLAASATHALLELRSATFGAAASPSGDEIVAVNVTSTCRGYDRTPRS